MNPQTQKAKDYIEYLKAEDRFFQPFLGPVLDRAVEQIEWPEGKGGAELPYSKEEVVASFREYHSELLTAHKDRLRILLGFDLIIENLDRIAGGDLCKKELKAAGLRMMEDVREKVFGKEEEIGKVMKKLSSPPSGKKGGKAPEGERAVKAVMQHIKPFREEVGISYKSFCIMYEVGLLLFDEGKYEEASCVFKLLSILDVTCHQVWYSLGLSFQRLADLPESIANYSIAALTDASNIAVWTSLAWCYMAARDWNLAEENLNMAKYVLSRTERSDEEKRGWSSVIKDLEKRVHERNFPDVEQGLKEGGNNGRRS